ncbi:MAG: hypothetical protein WC389_13000 [Lutibacter sp.]
MIIVLLISLFLVCNNYNNRIDELERANTVLINNINPMYQDWRERNCITGIETRNGIQTIWSEQPCKKTGKQYIVYRNGNACLKVKKEDEVSAYKFSETFHNRLSLFKGK